jgi:hypothetical protein
MLARKKVFNVAAKNNLTISLTFGAKSLKKKWNAKGFVALQA